MLEEFVFPKRHYILALLPKVGLYLNHITKLIKLTKVNLDWAIVALSVHLKFKESSNQLR